MDTVVNEVAELKEVVSVAVWMRTQARGAIALPAHHSVLPQTRDFAVKTLQSRNRHVGPLVLS